MLTWSHRETATTAEAVLSRLLEMLQQLLQQDESGHIDLAACNLSEREYTRLRETLGEGEVVAMVSNYGEVEVRATGYSGVWWVRHRGAEGQSLSEFIEVNYCPEVLIAETESVQEARDALKARLLAAQLQKNRH